MSMANIELLRKQARELLKNNPNSLAFRSCWKCNGAHGHLKKADGVVICCFSCGHWYYKGKDITKRG